MSSAYPLHPFNSKDLGVSASQLSCVYESPEGFVRDREDGRETQEGEDMGIYGYV